jgi:hypothetical protein
MLIRCREPVGDHQQSRMFSSSFFFQLGFPVLYFPNITYTVASSREEQTSSVFSVPQESPFKQSKRNLKRRRKNLRLPLEV